MHIHRCWINEHASVHSISMRMSKEEYNRCGSVPSLELQVMELPNREDHSIQEKHLSLGMLDRASLELLHKTIGNYLDNN